MRSLFHYTIVALTLLLISGFIWVKVDTPPEAPPQIQASGNILLVVGNTSLSQNDANIKAFLESMGLSIAVKSASSATSGDATSKDLVFIAPSAHSGNPLGATFKDTPVPVVSCAPATYGSMQMTGTINGTDYGQLNRQSTDITLSSHLLAAGLSGSVNITYSTQQVAFGKPSDAAIKVGVLDVTNNKYAIFAYETGATMVGMNAPARRLGLFLYTQSAQDMTADGWKLFESAVWWALANGIPTANGNSFIGRYGTGTDAHYGVMELSDGKIGLIGSGPRPGGSGADRWDFQYIRLQSNGSLDNMQKNYQTDTLAEDSQNRAKFNIFCEAGQNDLVVAIEENYPGGNNTHPVYLRINKHTGADIQYFKFSDHGIPAAMTATDDGGFLLANTSFYGTAGAYAIFQKVNADGTLPWTKSKYASGVRPMDWQWISNTQSWVLARYYNGSSLDNELVLMEINPASGSAGTHKYYAPSGFDKAMGYSLSRLNNGNMIAVGQVSNSSGTQAFWQMFTSGGSIISDKGRSFNMDQLDLIAYNVAATNDGGFVVVGASGNSFSGSSIDTNPFLSKYDANGNHQWSRQYEIQINGYPNPSMFYQINQTNDGGFLIGGGHFAGNSANYPALVLKTDSQGFLPQDQSCQVFTKLPAISNLTFSDASTSISLIDHPNTSTSLIDLQPAISNITDGGWDIESANSCPNNLPPVAIINNEAPNGLTVQFNGGASYDPEGLPLTEYLWNFGDGNTATGVTPSHTFSSTSTYTISLQVKDADQQTNSTNLQLQLSSPNNPPEASFTWQVDNGNSLKIDFDASASSDPDGNTLTYSWTYGDGGSLNDDNDPYTSNTYSSTGSYSVTLTVKDEQGLTDDTTQVVSVVDPNAITDAWLEAECADLSSNSIWQVIADNNASNANYLKPTADNSTGVFSATPAGGTDEMVSYSFNVDVAATTYKLYLRLLAPNSNANSVWLQVQPNQNSPNSNEWIKWNDLPTSSSYEWYQAYDSDNNNDPYLLNLQTGQNTLYIHTREANIQVDKIYVSLAGNLPTGEGNPAPGCSPSNQAPVLDPIADQTNEQFETVSLTASATDPNGDVLTFSATGLPDGLSMNPTTGEMSGTLTASLGTYPVSVSVQDDGSPLLSDQVNFTWTVIDPNQDDPPVAVLVASPNSGIAPLSVNLDGSLSTDDQGIITYYWDFGNGQTDTTTVDQVNHSYSTLGSYTARLIVQDNAGQTDTAYASISVSSPPVNQPPVLDPIADQTDQENTLASLTPSPNATDPDGDALSFSATGLPDGLSIDPTTGAISGTLTAAVGDYPVIVTVSDNGSPNLSDTQAFTWTITPSPPVTADEFWLEAECTSLGTSWANIAETDAANGNAREFIAASVWNGSHITEGDKITFSFNLATTATYTVFARVKGIGGGNSMWTKMNSEAWIQQDFDSDGIYKWYQLGTHNLSAGANTYELSGRETGVKLDKIYVTLNGSQPQNKELGPIGSNCGPQPNQGPTAIINPNPYVGQAPISLTFDGSFSTDDKGIVQYQWEVGGMLSTGTQDFVSTSFPLQGTYEVILTVWDEEGLWDTDTASITLSSPTESPTGTILFIVGDENLSINPGDQAVYNRLTLDLGYTVEKEKDTDYDPSDLQNKILVLISSSIGSGNIWGSNEQSLIDTQLPIINYEAAYHDDLKLVAGSSNSGTSYGELQLQIVEPDHYMAAQLSGIQTPYTGSGSMNWGEPTSSAIVVAREPANLHPVIFGYESGSQMDGITAPARRVGFFLHDDKADNLTLAQGWPLFDAAVCWALGCDLFVPICISTPIPVDNPQYQPPMGSVSPSTNQNYIRSTSFRKPGGGEPVNSLGYFDGLGRNILSVDVQATPLGKDMRVPVTYDIFGRQSTQQLPISSGTTGDFNIPGAGSFYSSTNFPYIPGADLAVPYSQIEFEASPLNRVLKQTGPGDAGLWGNSNVTTEYLSNTGGEKGFNPDGSSLTYAAGELSVVKITDENGGTTETATDKLGRTVYKKVKVELDTEVYATTTFGYNAFGNVKFVVQPMGAGTATNSYAFQYEYDGRQRIKRKRIPGTDNWTNIYYDELDRVIATKDPDSTIIATQYDDFGRPMKTGTGGIDGSISETYSETFYDTYSQGSFQASFPIPPFGQTPLVAPQVSDKVKGFVTAVKVKNLSTGTFLTTATFYDDYGREIQTQADNHLGGKEIVTSFYNFAGDLLATVLQHNVGGSNPVTVMKTFDYDHRGRLLRITQQVDDGDPTIIGQYAYNELGQLQDKRLHLNSCEEQLQTVDYTYNIRGWMTGINLTENAGSYELDLPCTTAGTPQDLFAMKLDYNEGFGTLGGAAMYNGNISGMQWQSAVLPVDPNLSECQKRGYGFTYDALNRLKTATYGAGESYTEEAGNYNIGLFYDFNGNIVKLDRNGLVGTNQYGEMDGLTYAYAGNRLTSISESKTTTPVGEWLDQFLGGSRSYGYDANGNITSDGDKTITYNYLNKPENISLTGGTITYTYAADGTKLQQISPEGIYDYVGGFFYINDVLQHFSHEEGRVFNNAGEFRYEYNLTDHLGNVRVSFTDINEDGLIDTDPTVGEILQEDHYYPFGLRLGGLSTTTGVPNRYRYNGKELHDELGLNWYDYGARMYDAAIGRWNGVDALAEEYAPASPYNYVLNNPLIFIDPDGRTIRDANGTIVKVKKGKDEEGNRTLTFSGKKGKELDEGTLEILNTLSQNELGQDLILSLKGSRYSHTLLLSEESGLQFDPESGGISLSYGITISDPSSGLFGSNNTITKVYAGALNLLDENANVIFSENQYQVRDRNKEGFSLITFDRKTVIEKYNIQTSADDVVTDARSELTPNELRIYNGSMEREKASSRRSFVGLVGYHELLHVKAPTLSEGAVRKRELIYYQQNYLKSKN